MGVFDFLFGKKDGSNKVSKPEEPENDGLLTKTEVRPGIMVSKVFAQNWKNIEKTALPAVTLTAMPNDQVSPTQSSFGAIPCIPENFEYPKDDEGNYLFPLAQINFREVPHLDGYPESGYLQMFISPTDEMYGLDLNNPCSQKNFRILFFEEKEVEVYKTDFSFLDGDWKENYGPMNKAYSLHFNAATDYVGIGDIRYDENKVFNVSALEEQYPLLADDIAEAASDDFATSGHKIGGYAYFTQYDPRDSSQKSMLLLLQIDTDDDIMWGDSGVANFFIEPEDLKNKDFSKVLYNWDCF